MTIPTPNCFASLILLIRIVAINTSPISSIFGAGHFQASTSTFGNTKTKRYYYIFHDVEHFDLLAQHINAEQTLTVNCAWNNPLSSTRFKDTNYVTLERKAEMTAENVDWVCPIRLSIPEKVLSVYIEDAHNLTPLQLAIEVHKQVSDSKLIDKTIVFSKTARSDIMFILASQLKSLKISAKCFRHDADLADFNWSKLDIKGKPTSYAEN
ncbi:hypothetical protein BT96DRAFT_927608 [Gymnopus androsaceus JB14]|uniref:Uncharacterized protein n=1 Tax=Gymnopus androsaceus JB14 TaxID=1447944 RepID=A0A6A4GQM0_9AGAR|nr:hypothetical protein BT96DRAFT_927608 [Gymnopus androsaceus JB14]